MCLLESQFITPPVEPALTEVKFASHRGEKRPLLKVVYKRKRGAYRCDLDQPTATAAKLRLWFTDVISWIHVSGAGFSLYV